MFNKDLRDAAQNRLKRTAKDFEKTVKETQKSAGNLYEVRIQLKDNLDQSISLINGLKNTPYDLSIVIEQIKVSVGTFNNVIKKATIEAHNADKNAKNMAAGAIAGVGVAALAPTAAMGIATTFGVASTGTAISALSGAAATNAALAWLGGGALAAGGAGVAGGEALLALAGPAGWVFGGVALGVSGLIANGKNKKLAEEANEKTAEIASQIRVQKLLTEEINQIKNLTKKDLTYLENANLKIGEFGTDYSLLSKNQKTILIAFLNNVRVAAKRLNAIIGERGYNKEEKKPLENTNLDDSVVVTRYGGTAEYGHITPNITVNALSDARGYKIVFNGKVSRLSLLDEPGKLTVNFSKIEITKIEGTSTVVRKPFYAVSGFAEADYIEKMNYLNDGSVHSFNGTVELDDNGHVYLSDVR